MIRALYTAASGMSAQQTSLDTIANNLANSATTGFHQRQVQFEDMIYQNLITPGSAQTQQTLSAGLQVGLGTKSAASEVIMTQGDFNQTNGPLDLAIQGAGFFQISRPDGTIAYTVPATSIPTIRERWSPRTAIPFCLLSVSLQTQPNYDLSVWSRIGDAARPDQAAQLGTIQLATFANPGGLNSIGGNLLQQTASSGNPITDAPGGTTGMGTLQQGYLENSNVDVVAEFVQMILAQRAYESNSKVIHVADDMYSQVNGLIR